MIKNKISFLKWKQIFKQMQSKKPTVNKVRIDVKEYILDRSNSKPAHSKHITFMNSDDFKNSNSILDKENYDINKGIQKQRNLDTITLAGHESFEGNSNKDTHCYYYKLSKEFCLPYEEHNSFDNEIDNSKLEVVNQKMLNKTSDEIYTFSNSDICRSSKESTNQELYEAITFLKQGGIVTHSLTSN